MILQMLQHVGRVAELQDLDVGVERSGPDLAVLLSLGREENEPLRRHRERVESLLLRRLRRR